MVPVNVGDQCEIQFIASRRPHLPQNVGSDPFPRPQIRIWFLRIRDRKRVLRGSLVDENGCPFGAEDEGRVSPAIRQMVNIERTGLPGF